MKQVLTEKTLIGDINHSRSSCVPKTREKWIRDVEFRSYTNQLASVQIWESKR